MRKIYKGYQPTQIERVPNETGESIEEMIRRQISSNQPISAEMPMIYTDKKDGVLPQYDPRTDRQELALDALDNLRKSEAMKTDTNPSAEGQDTQPDTDVTQLNF